jgi:3-hydroxyisobutyrate dehydrogenase-like beta-hydroxyacid dehydrogenase
MRKDLGLAAEVLPAVELASLTREILEQVAAAGHGADDVAALITALETDIATT